MEDYLDPEEEFMMMHQDELELMNEMEQENEDVFSQLEASSGPQKRSKRSLDFGRPEKNVLQRANSMGVERMISNSSNSENEDRQEKSSERTKSSVKRSLDAELSSPSKKKDKENYEDAVDPELYKEAESTGRKSNDNDFSKKRSVDYLFGDIDDIELEEASTSRGVTRNGQAKKRARHRSPELFQVDPPPLSKDEEDGILIERIKAMRKSVFTPVFGRTSDQTDWKTESESVTYGVPKWPFIVATNSEGERLYVRLNTEAKLERECNQLSVQEKMSDLLGEPYSAIKAAAHDLLAKRQQEAIEQEGITATTSRPTDPANTKLWVEKYKPKSYSELLSDTTINRSLLQWLKLWNKVVFDIDVKPKQKKAVQEDKKGQWKNNRGWNKNPAWNKKGGVFVNEELDENGCPMQKVVLLCGPPGLGKTTLAYIVAKKAGYNVVEMNASDDRSPETFRTHLEAATQMSSVMGKDPRPNCLVLDEIDGAPAPAIDVLVKFVSGNQSAKGRGKKKEGKGFVLKRPIVCICNDPYVPALRPLRQIALTVTFPQTCAETLSTRLLEIARRERIRTDLGAMLALCAKSHNDIRSCLSSLFYYKTKGGMLTLSEILRSNVGQKDVHKGLFSVWQDIFQIPRAKGAHTTAFAKDGGRTPVNKVEDDSIASRMDKVMQSVQTFGDYERLANGVFENYPNMKFRDSSMIEVAIGTEWFCRMDLITTHINSTQDYALMKYLPFAFSLWHVLFATRERPKIMYPSASYEASVKQANVRHIVDDVMKGMSPGVRSHTNRCQLVLEVLPFVTEIIVPVFRPVSLELYSLAEKQVMQNVVDIMIDFNLSYVQERTHDSLYISKLDPNILDVVYGDQGAPVRKLTHTAKQILSREIEREKMRRLDVTLGENPQKDGKPATKKTAPANKLVPVPLALEKPAFKPIIKEVAKKDFFGRIICEPDSPRTIKAKTVRTVKGNIWFHFKEGFNNAVRRRIKMESLM